MKGESASPPPEKSGKMTSEILARFEAHEGLGLGQSSRRQDKVALSALQEAVHGDELQPFKPWKRIPSSSEGLRSGDGVDAGKRKEIGTAVKDESAPVGQGSESAAPQVEPYVPVRMGRSPSGTPRPKGGTQSWWQREGLPEPAKDPTKPSGPPITGSEPANPGDNDHPEADITFGKGKGRMGQDFTEDDIKQHEREQIRLRGNGPDETPDARRPAEPQRREGMLEKLKGKLIGGLLRRSSGSEIASSTKPAEGKNPPQSAMGDLKRGINDYFSPQHEFAGAGNVGNINTFTPPTKQADRVSAADLNVARFIPTGVGDLDPTKRAVSPPTNGASAVVAPPISQPEGGNGVPLESAEQTNGKVEARQGFVDVLRARADQPNGDSSPAPEPISNGTVSALTESANGTALAGKEEALIPAPPVAPTDSQNGKPTPEVVEPNISSNGVVSPEELRRQLDAMQKLPEESEGAFSGRIQRLLGEIPPGDPGYAEIVRAGLDLIDEVTPSPQVRAERAAELEPTRKNLESAYFNAHEREWNDFAQSLRGAIVTAHRKYGVKRVNRMLDQVKRCKDPEKLSPELKKYILGLTGETQEVAFEYLERQRHIVTAKDRTVSRVQGKRIAFDTPVGSQQSVTENPSLGVKFIQKLQKEREGLTKKGIRTPEEEQRLREIKLLEHSSRFFLDRGKISDALVEQVAQADMRRWETWFPDFHREDPYEDSLRRIDERREIVFPRVSVEGRKPPKGKGSDNGVVNPPQAPNPPSDGPDSEIEDHLPGGKVPDEPPGIMGGPQPDEPDPQTPKVPKEPSWLRDAPWVEEETPLDDIPEPIRAAAGGTVITIFNSYSYNANDAKKVGGWRNIAAAAGIAAGAYWLGAHHKNQTINNYYPSTRVEQGGEVRTTNDYLGDLGVQIGGGQPASATQETGSSPIVGPTGDALEATTPPIGNPGGSEVASNIPMPQAPESIAPPVGVLPVDLAGMPEAPANRPPPEAPPADLDGRIPPYNPTINESPVSPGGTFDQPAIDPAVARIMARSERNTPLVESTVPLVADTVTPAVIEPPLAVVGGNSSPQAGPSAGIDQQVIDPASVIEPATVISAPPRVATATVTGPVTPSETIEATVPVADTNTPEVRRPSVNMSTGTAEPSVPPVVATVPPRAQEAGAEAQAAPTDTLEATVDSGSTSVETRANEVLNNTYTIVIEPESSISGAISEVRGDQRMTPEEFNQQIFNNPDRMFAIIALNYDTLVTGWVAMGIPQDQIPTIEEFATMRKEGDVKGLQGYIDSSGAHVAGINWVVAGERLAIPTSLAGWDTMDDDMLELIESGQFEEFQQAFKKDLEEREAKQATAPGA